MRWTTATRCRRCCSGSEVTVLMFGWIAVWALQSRFQREQQFWPDAWAGTRLIDVQPDAARRRQ